VLDEGGRGRDVLAIGERAEVFKRVLERRDLLGRQLNQKVEEGHRDGVGEILFVKLVVVEVLVVRVEVGVVESLDIRRLLRTARPRQSAVQGLDVNVVEAQVFNLTELEVDVADRLVGGGPRCGARSLDQVPEPVCIHGWLVWHRPCTAGAETRTRSEERRVGKERRARWAQYH